MNIIDENTTVGSLVSKNPEYARVFEKLGLDYCCKGNRTLKDACEQKNLNLDNVLKNLQQTPVSEVSINWDQMSTKELINHIINTYHTFARQELPRISQLLKKVNIKHGHRYAHISELLNVYEEMKDSLLKHMDEEEQLVFPLIANLEVNKGAHEEKIKEFVNSLDEDHLATGAALEKIRELTNNYTPPADACMTHIVMVSSLERLEQNTHEHVHKENQILFPRVKAASS